jgi:hypothetical protein
MSTNTWLKRLAGRKHRGVTILDRTEVPEGTCETCTTPGKELRPYGRNGEWICFDCGMKDEKTTGARFNEVVFGDKQH